MNFYLITVPGKYGYKIPVMSELIGPNGNFENDVINGAIKKNLFYDSNEGNSASVEVMSKFDYEHFSKPGMNIHNID